MTAAGGDPQQLLRVAERISDRLRVIGPRMAARSGADAAALLTGIRSDLQRLADVGADAERRSHRPLPVLAPHALGDQVLVLAHDVAASGGPADVASAVAVLSGLSDRL